MASETDDVGPKRRREGAQEATEKEPKKRSQKNSKKDKEINLSEQKNGKRVSMGIVENTSGHAFQRGTGSFEMKVATRFNGVS